MCCSGGVSTFVVGRGRRLRAAAASCNLCVGLISALIASGEAPMAFGAIVAYTLGDCFVVGCGGGEAGMPDGAGV